MQLNKWMNDNAGFLRRQEPQLLLLGSIKLKWKAEFAELIPQVQWLQFIPVSSLRQLDWFFLAISAFFLQHRIALPSPNDIWQECVTYFSQYNVIRSEIRCFWVEGCKSWWTICHFPSSATFQMAEVACAYTPEQGCHRAKAGTDCNGQEAWLNGKRPFAVLSHWYLLIVTAAKLFTYSLNKHLLST